MTQKQGTDREFTLLSEMNVLGFCFFFSFLKYCLPV